MPTRSASSSGVLPQLQGLKRGQRTCLGYIRRRGECSRDEIERYFGWKPETISRALKPLVDQGILLTRSRTPAGQGRRRTFLYLNPELFCAIGVEITFSHIRRPGSGSLPSKPATTLIIFFISTKIFRQRNKRIYPLLIDKALEGE